MKNAKNGAGRSHVQRPSRPALYCCRVRLVLQQAAATQRLTPEDREGLPNLLAYLNWGATQRGARQPLAGYLLLLDVKSLDQHAHGQLLYPSYEDRRDWVVSRLQGLIALLRAVNLLKWVRLPGRLNWSVFVKICATVAYSLDGLFAYEKAEPVVASGSTLMRGVTR